MNKLKEKRLLKISRVKNYGITERNEKKLWLDKNENNHSKLYKLINKTLKKIKFEDFYSYPNFSKLYKIIAFNEKIKKENILLTAGADAAIKIIFETLLEKNDQIFITHPSFAMYKVYSKIYNVKFNQLLYKRKLNKFYIDLKKLEKKIISKKIKAIFLPNPDSPSGHYYNNKQILKLISICRMKDVYLIIDEAYFPFSEETSIKLLRKYERLVIIRTGSKSFGLAGLRVGFIASNKYLINLFSKFKPIYEISNLSAKFYYNFYLNLNYIRQITKSLISTKKQFEIFLKDSKFDLIDTKGNFVLVNFGKNHKIIKKKIFSKAYIKNNIYIDKEQYSRLTITEMTNLEKIKRIIKNETRK